MTKISSKTAYPKKKPISSDYFVGTDSEDFNKTVNFGFEEVAGLVNKLNGTPLLNYLFSTSPYLSTEVLLEGRFLSDENELSTPSLTKLHVNKFNNSGDNLQELYLFLQANATDFYLKLRNSNNQNNAVYFDISSIEDFPDYFILNISIFKENEFLPLLQNLNVYFFDFELKAIATGASDPLKLDKGGYEGTAQDLNNSIKNIAFPDDVLKTGEIVITGLNAFVSAGDFQWRLNQVDFLTAPEFSEDIDPATEGFKRTDILEGDNAGIIHLKKGVENESASPEPSVTAGRIRLAGIPVSGSTIGTPSLPIVGDKFILKIEKDGWLDYDTTGNNAFIPAPSTGQALLIVYNTGLNSLDGVDFSNVVNAYNGQEFKILNRTGGPVTLNPNAAVGYGQARFLLFNEQSLVIPDTGQVAFYNFNKIALTQTWKSWDEVTDEDLVLKVDKVTGKGLSTEDYTTSEKNKLASITEIFTTALKSSYDGVVTGYNALIATGSRLITSGEITKLTNTSGTNSGDNATNTQYSGLAASKQDTLVPGTNIKTLDGDSLLGSGNLLPKTELAYALADETTNLTVDTRIKFRMPHAMTLSEVRISLNDAPTLSSVVVDVKENGVSIFSTLLSIDANEKTSVTAATPAVISDVNLADDAEITVSTTQIGSGDTGKGLKILFKGRKV